MSRLKRLILLLSFVLINSSQLFAQFHLEIGMSKYHLGNLEVAGPWAEKPEGGAGLYFEPKYAFNDHVDLGIHIGKTFFFQDRVAFLTTILGTYVYRFKEDQANPYIGLGAGVYLIDGGKSLVEGVLLGLAPKLGVYAGRFNLGVALNITPKASFMQMNLGFRIGGRE